MGFIMDDSNDEELRALVLSDHLRRKRNAESWNPEQEAIIVAWAEKSEALRWMHQQAASHARRSGAQLIYSSILFSFISGVLSLATAGLEKVTGMGYVVSAFSILSAVLTSFEQFDRPMDRAGEHQQAAENFAMFFRSTSLELSLNPEDRRAFLDYMQLAKADYERLLTTSPTLPDDVVEEYAAKFKNRRNQPEIVAADIGSSIELKTYKKDDGKMSPEDYAQLKKYYNMKFGEVPAELRDYMQTNVEKEEQTDHDIADLENQISRFA